MTGDTFAPEDRDAVAFLLACVYCGPRPRKIAQLAKLKRVAVRQFLHLTAKYLTDPKYGLVMQWPDEKYGDISASGYDFVASHIERWPELFVYLIYGRCTAAELQELRSPRRS
jgi:hypothetical protein